MRLLCGRLSAAAALFIWSREVKLGRASARNGLSLISLETNWISPTDSGRWALFSYLGCEAAPACLFALAADGRRARTTTSASSAT